MSCRAVNEPSRSLTKNILRHLKRKKLLVGVFSRHCEYSRRLDDTSIRDAEQEVGELAAVPAAAPVAAQHHQVQLVHQLVLVLGLHLHQSGVSKQSVDQSEVSIEAG